MHSTLHKKRTTHTQLTGVMFIACAFLSLSTFDLALADCSTIGKQGHEDDLNSTAALNEYVDVAAAISKNPNQSERIEKGLSANGKVTDAINRQILTLEKGKAENCFGSKSAEWETILNALRSKRAELENERETIAKFRQADQKAKPTRGNWQAFLEPSLKAFSVCLVLKKRQYLNSGQPRPSPSDFALIVRGACNDEEAQIETEQNKIEGWMPEDRQIIKTALVSLRAKSISEYTEAFHKAN